MRMVQNGKGFFALRLRMTWVSMRMVQIGERLRFGGQNDSGIEWGAVGSLDRLSL